MISWLLAGWQFKVQQQHPFQPMQSLGIRVGQRSVSLRELRPVLI
jgi:hypothetical protein